MTTALGCEGVHMVRRVLRAEWLFRCGQRLAAQEHFDQAIETFTQAQALRPGAAGIYLHRALALAQISRWPEAVLNLRQAMALQPANAVLPMFLGRMYLDHADYANAALWCARALALRPTNCHALALQALIELARGQIQQGLQRLQQPVPLPVSMLERSFLWCSRSHVPTLLQQANAALQGRVLLHVETFLLQHGALARTLAQQLLASSVTHNDTTFADRLLTGLDGYLTRGIMGIRRLGSALRYAFQPADRALHLCFLQAEDAAYHSQAATAQALYTQVAQQDPDMPYIQERLCEVCYIQGKFREALRHLRRLIKQLPDPDQPGADLAVLLGELLYQVGQYQKARATLTKVSTSATRDYRLWYYLGLCQLQAGTPQVAQRSFVHAVQQLNPDIAALRLAEMSRVSQGRC
jgi:tetratricopeptide (TPR) repeat protein